MKKRFSLSIALIFCFFCQAADQGCHFLSLKSSEVNLRVGPGEEYPIAWVLTKSGLPIKLIAEYNNWRKVQLVDGTEGWIHVNIISRKNTAIVKNPHPTIRKIKNSNNEKLKNFDIEEPFCAVLYKYNSHSRPIARVEENVVVRVLKREENMIKIDVNHIKGWIDRENLWGVED